MNRFHLENLYQANGLEDYKLRTTEDLLKCHGIDFKSVDGYNRIDDINRAIYEKFIINFMNGLGLESRAELVPKGIYWVEDTTYLVKENQEDDYFTVAGGHIDAIDRSGLKTVLHTWIDEDYKHLEITEKEAEKYLRFVYEHGTYEDGTPRKEWLHVIKEGKEWY
jgi:hypothetical protein